MRSPLVTGMPIALVIAAAGEPRDRAIDEPGDAVKSATK